MIADLGILQRLDALREVDLQDVDALLGILLRKNHLDSRSHLCSRIVERLADSFCWNRACVRDFLTGAIDRLVSETVEVRRIHATDDFCLMEWSFRKPTRFFLPRFSGTRFTFFVVQGRASVVKRAGQANSRCIPVRAGGTFQGDGAEELGCSFSAGTEALFFDFPPFRAAQRQSGAIQEFLPLATAGPRVRSRQSNRQILPAKRVRSQRRSISDSM